MAFNLHGCDIIVYNHNHIYCDSSNASLLTSSKNNVDLMETDSEQTELQQTSSTNNNLNS